MHAPQVHQPQAVQLVQGRQLRRNLRSTGDRRLRPAAGEARPPGCMAAADGRPTQGEACTYGSTGSTGSEPGRALSSLLWDRSRKRRLVSWLRPVGQDLNAFCPRFRAVRPRSDHTLRGSVFLPSAGAASVASRSAMPCRRAQPCRRIPAQQAPQRAASTAGAAFVASRRDLQPPSATTLRQTPRFPAGTAESGQLCWPAQPDRAAPGWWLGPHRCDVLQSRQQPAWCWAGSSTPGQAARLRWLWWQMRGGRAHLQAERVQGGQQGQGRQVQVRAARDVKVAQLQLGQPGRQQQQQPVAPQLQARQRCERCPPPRQAAQAGREIPGLPADGQLLQLHPRACGSAPPSGHAQRRTGGRRAAGAGWPESRAALLVRWVPIGQEVQGEHAAGELPVCNGRPRSSCRRHRQLRAAFPSRPCVCTLRLAGRCHAALAA